MKNFKKYPRTFHLPSSVGCTSDDKKMTSVAHFENQRIVTTLKMDGENTSLYHNGMHARSLDSNNHPSRSWIQNKLGEIQHLMPETLRICGENLFARHSLEYNALSSYFLVFSAWEEKLCLSWEDTVHWAQQLGLETVPVIYEGIFDEAAIKKSFVPYSKDHEGYVVRLVGSFSYDQFSTSVGKFVRENHVQTDEHWMNQSIIKNKLRT